MDPGIGPLAPRRQLDLLRVIGACYGMAGSEQDRLGRLLEALEPVATPLGLAAWAFVPSPTGLEVSARATRGSLARCWRHIRWHRVPVPEYRLLQWLFFTAAR